MKPWVGMFLFLVVAAAGCPSTHRVADNGQPVHFDEDAVRSARFSGQVRGVTPFHVARGWQFECSADPQWVLIVDVLSIEGDVIPFGTGTTQSFGVHDVSELFGAEPLSSAGETYEFEIEWVDDTVGRRVFLGLELIQSL